MSLGVVVAAVHQHQLFIVRVSVEAHRESLSCPVCPQTCDIVGRRLAFQATRLGIEAGASRYTLVSIAIVPLPIFNSALMFRSDIRS
jgi:hypothetical protein